MHHLQAFALLIAAVAGSPVTVPRNGTTPTTPNTYHSYEVLSACHAAHNCETYSTPRGTMIRFVAGKEPGSPWYSHNAALSKRSEGDKTHVTFGDGSVDYGSLGPYGAIHHLFDSCHEGSCDTSDATYSTRVATSLNEHDTTLTLHSQGQYDGWDQRDVFVNAMVAAATQGQRCEDTEWMHGGYQSGVESGKVYQCTQTSFLSINHFGSDGSLKGYMSVNVEQGDEDRNWCAVIAGILGGVAGVIGSVPGAGEVGGLFGVISAVCS